MEIQMRKGHLIILIGISIILLVFSVSPVMAHSTKGRVKVPLDKDTLGVDDVAFFVESYVNRHLYDDGTPSTRNRYIVEEFKGVDQSGSRLNVRFTVFDKKEINTFAAELTMTRGADGIWRYLEPNSSKPIDIFTYVSKGVYYQKKYGTAITVSLGLVCCGLVGLWIYRKKRSADMPDWGTLTGQAQES